MPFFLKSHWKMLIDSNDHYLFNNECSWPTWWHLNDIHFFVFSSLDGVKNENSLAASLSTYAKITEKKALSIVRQLLRRFHQCIGKNHNLSPIKPNVFKINESLSLGFEQKIRNCAPIRLSWIATTSCYKKCKYCYMDAKPVEFSQKSIIPFSAFKTLAEEARQLAVSEVVITGGEPLVLDNITDIINLFVENEFFVTLGTKSTVDCLKLSCKAKEFLVVEQSIDSTERVTFDSLTGIKGSYEEAVTSLGNMKTFGIPFRVKMVVGNKNVNDVVKMAQLCDSYGAISLSVVEYRSSLGRNIEDFCLNDEMRINLVKEVDTLRNVYDYDFYLDLDIPFENKVDLPGSRCSEGIKTLSFLFDGTCTRCPMIPMDTRITSGNVFNDGIYSTWNDNPQYESLIFPDEPKFLNTICHNCSLFDQCNNSGRCLVKSLQNSDKLFGPDRNCSFFEKSENIK